MAYFMPINISAVQLSTAAVTLNSHASSRSTVTYLQRRPRWHNCQLAVRPANKRASLKVTFAERGYLMRNSARDNLKGIMA
jgi:hypothetical protein